MSFVLGALGIGKAILGFLKSLPWWIYAIIGGILALLFAWHVHTGKVKDAYNAAYNKGWSVEHANHEITLRSLDHVMALLAAKNAESDARAKAYADAKAADARTVAEMDRRYRGTAGRVASLEAIARVPGGSVQCKAPRAVTDALEGL
jgi:hypothetical protein